MVSAFVSKMSQPGPAFFDEEAAALKGHGFIRATNREISTRL
jgi:hypothetical protein